MGCGVCSSEPFSSLLEEDARWFSLIVSALLAASALFRHGPPEGHAGATWALCRLPLQWIPQVLLQWPAGPVPSVLDGLSQSRLHLTVSVI